MKNKISGYRARAILLTLLFGSFSFTSAYGFSTGNNGNCSGCHAGTGDVTIEITGPTEVAIDSTHSYVLTLSGGPGVVGGLNVFAATGTFTATDTDTEVRLDEIVNTASRDFEQVPVRGTTVPTVSWTFDWTAPGVIGAVDLMAFGLSANGDGLAFQGIDVTAFTTLTVQVIPIPAALLLFSSGLAVLGWARRRPST